MESRRVGVGFGVMLMRDGHVLLGQRHPDPEKASSLLDGAGQWTFPGGKLHFGESFEAAARREVSEETGIDVSCAALELISITNNIGKNAHFVTLGFVAETFSGEPQIMEPDEITCWQWFSLQDLPAPLYGPSAEIIERYQVGSIYVPAGSVSNHTGKAR